MKSPDAKIYLQQRSNNDDWLPGLWTASCTGHVKAGESPDQAAKRELEEELGLGCLPVYLFKFLAPRIESGARVEYEMNYVYECTAVEDPVIDRREVEQMKLLSIEECSAFFATKRNEITPDSIVAYEKFCELISSREAS
ncbi:MAG: NUDIX domain-containing protein [Nitrososphaerota archaeon]|nr:NUDIX domain-containing protein [Nitrososphaerota archaeon]